MPTKNVRKLNNLNVQKYMYIFLIITEKKYIKLTKVDNGRL